MAQYSQNLIGMGAGDYVASSARRKQARQNLIGMGGFSQQAARMSALDQMAGTPGMNYAGGSRDFDESSGRYRVPRQTPGGRMQPPRDMVRGMRPLPQLPRPGAGTRVPNLRDGTARTLAPVGGQGRPSPYDNIQVGSTISDQQLLNRTSPEFWTRLAQLGHSSPEGRAWAEELARRQWALMSGRLETMQILPGDRGRSNFRDVFRAPRTIPPATGGGRAV